jgi:hypothetical protein
MSYPADILVSAKDNIQQRAIMRDMNEERSMLRAVTTFNSLTHHSLTEHDGWIFMVLLKLARAYAGSFCEDDYIDAASYAALAAESLRKKET